MRPVPDALGPVATSLGELRIRPRRDDDAGVVLALYGAARADELALTGWDEAQRRAFLELQLRAREQHRDATRSGVELWMLEVAGATVGQLDLARGDEHVEVLEIALMPGLRGHGLGTAVLRAVLDEADATGRAVRLHVEVANVAARRLYERLGFAVVAEEGLHLAMERLIGGLRRPATPSVLPGAPSDSPGAPSPEEPAAPPGGPPQLLDAMPTYESLVGHVGETVAQEGGPDLRIAAVDLRPSPGDGRAPFSVLFEGPLDAPMGQGLARLVLPGTGPVDLFVVPLRPASGRAVYEAVVG